MSEKRSRRPRTTRQMVSRIRAVSETAMRLETQTSVLYGRHSNKATVDRISEVLEWCEKMDRYLVHGRGQGSTE